jgi:YegS/Rv2252/BmrU family lipid kinase
MKKKYILIVNPISGDIDKSEIIDKTLAFAAEFEVTIIVYKTTGQNDETAIRTLYNLHNPERVLILGGDGTIKMVGEALENQEVIFGILPAGSSNGLAVDLNLSSVIEDNFVVAFQNNFIEVDMVSINGKKSMHLSDIGVNAELVKNYQKSKTRGKLGYALQIITTLAELHEPFSAKIEVNNQTIKCFARMIVIANSQKYGTGVIINPDGKINDGKFEIVILKKLDLVVFAKIITGNIPVNAEDVEIISCEQAIITTNLPVSLQIDGEYIGEETQLNIKILPSHIKVAIP